MNQIIEVTDEVIFHVVYVAGYRFTVSKRLTIPTNYRQFPTSALFIVKGLTYTPVP